MLRSTHPITAMIQNVVLSAQHSIEGMESSDQIGGEYCGWCVQSMVRMQLFTSGLSVSVHTAIMALVLCRARWWPVSLGMSRIVLTAKKAPWVMRNLLTNSVSESSVMSAHSGEVIWPKSIETSDETYEANSSTKSGHPKGSVKENEMNCRCGSVIDVKMAVSLMRDADCSADARR